jgi:hypothetical protein
MNEHTLAVMCGLYHLSGHKLPYRSPDSRGNMRNFVLSKKKPIYVDTQNEDPWDNAEYIRDETFKLFVPTATEHKNGGRAPEVEA